MGIELALPLETQEGLRSRDMRCKRENPFKTEEMQLRMANLAKIHSKYQAIKLALQDPNVSDPELSLVSDDFNDVMYDTGKDEKL